jgi:hypothetical protein
MSISTRLTLTLMFLFFFLFSCFSASYRLMCRSSLSLSPSLDHPQRWQSIETAYFVRLSDVVVPCEGGDGGGGAGAGAGGAAAWYSGRLTLVVPPESVTTLSSRSAAVAGWANYTVPPRTRFALPHSPLWSTQAVDEPCRSLSPVYGAFEVATARTASGVMGTVCRQAVPQDPGANAWTHRRNSWPTALLPGGSNAANVAVSMRARFEGLGFNPTRAVSVCGRTPIWAPAKCQPNGFTLGVCLTLLWTTPSSGQDNGVGIGTINNDRVKNVVAETLTWRLTEANNQYHQKGRDGGCDDVTILANGTLVVPAGGSVDAHWFYLSVNFSGATVTASIDGAFVASVSTTMHSGVVSIGTAWNTALFDGLVVAPHVNHPPTPTSSFLFDVLPSVNAVPGAACCV